MKKHTRYPLAFATVAALVATIMPLQAEQTDTKIEPTSKSTLGERIEPTIKPTLGEKTETTSKPILGEKSEPTLKPTLGEKIDDTFITSQVKAALLTHHSTSALKTKVETLNGEVTLSGVAKNEEEKSLVTKLVSDIHGVTSVKNQMTVEVAKTK